MNKKKFSDEQLLKAHSMGLNDGEIAKSFNCSDVAVFLRRVKLCLIANVRPKLDEKGLRAAKEKKIIKNLEYQKQIYINNKSKILEKNKQHYINNKSKILEKNKQYRINNKSKILAQQKQYRINNKSKISEREKQRYINNKSKILAQQKQYRINNKKKSKL